MASILALIIWVAAQQVVPPSTNPTQVRPAVRVTVSGITVRTDVSDSLASVTVKLTPLDEPPTRQVGNLVGLVVSNIAQVQSDAAGQFRFTGIAPGRYSISAEREGFVPQRQFLPGPRQSQQFILTIASGMNVDGLVVMMMPVPTISGTVYGPRGQRLAGATVQAYRIQYTPYGRRLVRVASVLSHEGGEYRLFRLAPGYYYISASYNERSLRLWKSLLELSPNLANPDEGYSTVYYPGEMKVADARVVNLHNGAVVNADIGFKDSQYFRLSIRVLLPPPQPPNIPSLQNPKVALLPAGADLSNAQDFIVQGSGTSFSVDRLAEGDYVAVVMAALRDLEGKSYFGIVSDTLPIRVTNDLEVTIPAMDPFDVPGTVSGLPNGTIREGMQIQLVRVDSFTSQTISAAVDTSGKFSLLGVGPGTYDVMIQGMPANAYLQSAGFANADRRSVQVRINATQPQRTWRCDGDCLNARQVSNVALSASISTGGVSVIGSVADANRGIVSGAQIVLVPTDEVLRLRKDRYGVAFSDAAGAFQVSGMMPGSYMAYAFEEIEPDIYLDPDFNAQIVRLGTPITVTGPAVRPLERPLTLVTRDDVARLTR